MDTPPPISANNGELSGLDYARQFTGAVVEYLETRQAGHNPNILQIAHRHVQHPNRAVRRVGYGLVTSALVELRRGLAPLPPADLEATIVDCLERMHINITAAELLATVTGTNDDNGNREAPTPPDPTPHRSGHTDTADDGT